MLIQLVDYVRANRDLLFPHKGTVVKNDDPLKLGRVKVLVEGLFPAADELPVREPVVRVDEEGNPLPDEEQPDPPDPFEALPWIHPITPVGMGGRTDGGSFHVPELDAELLVSFPYEDIHFGFYTGYWQSAATHQGRHNEAYPESYGTEDPTGLFWRVDKARKRFEFNHPSGLVIELDEDGNLNIESRGEITLSDSNGSAALIINDQGRIRQRGFTEAQRIEQNQVVRNRSINIRTGGIVEETTGAKEESQGAGYKRLTAGSDSVATVGHANRSIGGNESRVVGGEASHVYGQGKTQTIPLGNYLTEVLSGDIELKSLLANLKIPVSGIVELDGVAVQLGGGDQPSILGQDMVDLFMNHKHPTGTGMSGVPDNAADALQVLSKKVFNG